MEQMSVLLIEDEVCYRDDFRTYVKTLQYPLSFRIATGESEAVELVQRFSFDVIILDLELHESDGDGISFLRKLKHIPLPSKTRPYVIVASNIQSPHTRQTARDNGADYIFWKRKSDYSPELVMDFAYNFYLCKIKSEKRFEVKSIPPAPLEDEIRTRIGKISINDDMIGKKYIIDCIEIVAKSNNPNISLHGEVINIIAKKYNRSPDSITSGIQRAIEKAWSVTDQETIREFYCANYSGVKGIPTNKEFIFHYAQILKDLCKA